MALHLSIVIMVWCVLIQGGLTFTSNIKVGVSLGGSSTNTKKVTTSTPQLHYCTGKYLQLLHYLYVDYFQSSGPCLAPGGTKIYPYRSDQYGEEANGAMCARVPRVCQLMTRPRGRSLVEVGQKMWETFGNNVRSLYNVLTGRAFTASAPTTTATPAPSDPRLFKPHPLHPAAITYPTTQDCTHYGGCDGYGVRVCESVEDVVFPMVGVSALTNTTITIIQTFPDLLQPVFFRKCRSRQAQVVYGECIQEYLPVSLLVSPDHPGAVLAQDFVMVESGCHVAAHLTHYTQTGPREADQLHNTHHQQSTDRKDSPTPFLNIKDSSAVLRGEKDSSVPSLDINGSPSLLRDEKGSRTPLWTGKDSLSPLSSVPHSGKQGVVGHESISGVQDMQGTQTGPLQTQEASGQQGHGSLTYGHSQGSRPMIRESDRRLF